VPSRSTRHQERRVNKKHPPTGTTGRNAKKESRRLKIATRTKKNVPDREQGKATHERPSTTANRPKSKLQSNFDGGGGANLEASSRRLGGQQPYTSRQNDGVPNEKNPLKERGTGAGLKKRKTR